VDFRPFRNFDPPHIVDLWHSCGLGRGAAEGITPDAFEQTVFSRPHFDPHGLIVARDGPNLIGFVHAGFGPNDEQSDLNRDVGVICAVLVHPSCRRRGIGKELVQRAEEYLKAAGARTIIAGPAEPNTPFYVGLYGGVQPVGFLETDPAAVPFFTALGYEPQARHDVFQRDLTTGSGPVNVELMAIRRKSQLAVNQGPMRKSWWWQSRYGALDTLRFVLIPKDNEQVLASVTVVNLEMYLGKWQQQAVGLIDLKIPAEERREGYGQALIVEICRRLRDERFMLLEANAPEDDALKTAIYEAAGLVKTDTGTELRKSV